MCVCVCVHARARLHAHLCVCVCVCVCLGGGCTLFQLLTYLFYHKGHHFSCCSWWDSSQLPRTNTCVQPKSLSAFSHGGWQEGKVTFDLSLYNEMNIIHSTPKCKLSYHSAKWRIKIKIQADLFKMECNWEPAQHLEQNGSEQIYIFATGYAVATFQLMASYNYLAAHLYILLVCPCLLCVVCKESKYLIHTLLKLHSSVYCEYSINC